MIKLVWFIGRPRDDLEDAEQVYQIGHVERGMRQENLRSFRISRAVLPQPGPVREAAGGGHPPAVFRFSEGYWDSFEAIEECYRSPNGLAALADGMLNGTPRLPETPLPVLLAEEEHFPARGHLAFDIFRGRYLAAEPRKLFVFLKLRDPQGSQFDREYRELAESLGDLEDLGPHVLSRTRPYNLALGRARHWPPEGADHYERIVEYYFPSAGALSRFVDGDRFEQVLALAGKHSSAVVPVAVEPQHVFFTTTGDQPLSSEWKSLYAAESRDGRE